MKAGQLIFAVIFAAALIGHAQEKAPADQPAAATAPDTATTTTGAPETDKPVAQGAVTHGMTDNYVIGEIDQIAITVFKEPTLSSDSLLVRPDGMISMPLLGDVKAAGKTPMQLAADITLKLKQFIQDPNVTIIVKETGSKRIYLIGQVGKTGAVGMTSGMTLLQAIAADGGVSEFANTKKIYILRIENGVQQKIPVQYKEALRGDSTKNLILNPGDTIVVP
jgi:polysaccharide export outer membrane protein